MKLKPQVLSIISIISDYMASVHINGRLFATEALQSAGVFNSSDNCKEKLQIRFANIRV
jgi:hypothetical protein